MSLYAWLKSLLSREAGRSFTVRTMFSFVGAILLLGAAVINSNDVSYIKVTAPQKVVAEGSSFRLDVFAYAHVPVNAVDVTLHFDPEFFSVTSVDRGQSVLTLWTEDPIVGTNTVTLRGGTYRRGFVGEHKIATIELKAKKTGSSQLSAADAILLAGDGKGTQVTVAKSNTSAFDLVIQDKNDADAGIGAEVAVQILTDIDGDGKVSLSDVSSFMSAWAKKNYVYDFNNDGQMTFRDFSIILADMVLR
jgi:hypothetical protein